MLYGIVHPAALHALRRAVTMGASVVLLNMAMPWILYMRSLLMRILVVAVMTTTTLIVTMAIARAVVAAMMSTVTMVTMGHRLWWKHAPGGTGRNLWSGGAARSRRPHCMAQRQ